MLTALSVAVGLALLAPDDWEAGPGALEMEVAGSAPVRVPVEIGSTVPIEASVGGVTVSAPKGLPLDAPIELEITIGDSGPPSGLDDLDVVLVLADGSRERVPVYGVDGGSYDAARRPAANAAVVLAVLGAAIVLWVTELVPIHVTALGIPVVLTVAGVGAADAALAPFFDPIIVLFFAGFLLAEAMRRTGLDRLVALSVVALAGRGPRRLYAALIGLAATMSMFMSNTAAVTVLLPVAMAVTEPLASVGYRKAVVLGVAYAATIGGVGSAIGTPANPLAISFIEDLTGRTVSFAEWFAFGLPMVILFVPVMATYLWLVCAPRVDVTRMEEATVIARRQRRSSGRLAADQIQVLVVFAAIVALWLSETWHGVDTGVVALGGAVVLFALGPIETSDLGRISWPTLLTFGGGLTLGVFMVSTGSSDWLVTRLGGLAGWPQFAATAAVAAVALGLTTVASNTAAAATLVPLAIPLAALLGIDPVLLVVVVAIASSVDFALVIGTPPTMLAYSTDLFSVREILAKGALLDVAGIALLVFLVVPFWRAVGLV